MLAKVIVLMTAEKSATGGKIIKLAVQRSSNIEVNKVQKNSLAQFPAILFITAVPCFDFLISLNYDSLQVREGKQQELSALTWS